MERPWQPEREVDEELARSLIRAQFPDLADASIERLGAGWDNTVYEVGGEWVFRFPRRQIAVPLIETEVRLLPAVAEVVPLAIPVPVHVGEPTAEYPWPFAGYAKLSGTPACSVELSDDQRAAAAAPLAEFLVALHATHVDGAPPDSLGRADARRRLHMVSERLAALRQLGLVDDTSPWQRILDDTPLDFAPGADALCHGDLYARHLLIDDDRRPCGVIDWGDVHVGEPAVDLGIAHGFLPPAALDTFYARYGSITDAQLRFARLRALHYAAILPIYGRDVGDDALVREGMTALRFLRAS